MRIFFSVGEPSGDLHGANLIRDIKAIAPDVQCVGFGGPKMQQAGCNILFDLTSLAVMFIISALMHLPKFFRVLSQAKRYLNENKVDAVVLIDFPGFNWHIARAAKKRGIPVFYYGVPQMWAWAQWRIKKMRRDVDFALCKLPFEADWYKQQGCNATFTGHPYFDELAARKLDQAFVQKLRSLGKKRLTLLPGSRKQEVTVNTDTMIRVAKRVMNDHPDTHIVFACYKQSQLEYVRKRMERMNVSFDTYVDKTPELIDVATVCLACSGSVSLELMYHQKPTIILYRLGFIKWLIQSAVLKVKYITLVNLLAVKSIGKLNWKTYNPDASNAEHVPMPEYLSVSECSKPVANRVNHLLADEDARRNNIAELTDLKRRFAKTGASKTAASLIVNQLLAANSGSASRAA